MAKQKPRRRRPSTRSPTVAPKRDPLPANRNWLLAALPADDRKRLVPALDVIALSLKQILHPVGEAVSEVYFPGGGFVCVLVVLEDGRMIEVATIGREGLVGAAAALANMPVMAATVVQGDTDLCYRMTAEAFRREMARGGAFHDVMTRYAHAAAGAMMLATMCNAVHSIEQRLARWLLMAHDRMDRKVFPLTQEFAAMMLGASRPTVTTVAGGLQAAGLIAYHRGRVSILNRAGLELAACECYGATTRLLDVEH